MPLFRSLCPVLCAVSASPPKMPKNKVFVAGGDGGDGIAFIIFMPPPGLVGMSGTKYIWNAPMPFIDLPFMDLPFIDLPPAHDGAAVVGRRVGRLVGGFRGFFVGFFVGRFVGALVGAEVGPDVEPGPFPTVSIDGVRLTLGCSVGALVDDGDLVGASVG
jgi:hypothetical protein